MKLITKDNYALNKVLYFDNLLTKGESEKIFSFIENFGKNHDKDENNYFYFLLLDDYKHEKKEPRSFI